MSFIRDHAAAIAVFATITVLAILIVIYFLFVIPPSTDDASKTVTDDTSKTVTERYCDVTRNVTFSCPLGETIKVRDVKFGSGGEYDGLEGSCAGQKFPKYLPGADPGPTWTSDELVVSGPKSILDGQNSKAITFGNSAYGRGIPPPIKDAPAYWEIAYDCGT